MDTQHCKDVSFLQTDTGLTQFPSISQQDILKTETRFLKSVWKNKGTKIAEYLKKNKVGEITLPNFKMYCGVDTG